MSKTIPGKPIDHAPGEQGERDAEIREVQCCDCGCNFEIDLTDYDDNDYFSCPQCGQSRGGSGFIYY